VPSLKFKTLVVSETKSQHKCKELGTIHGKIMADLTIALDNVICCIAEYASPSSMEKLKDFREDMAQTEGEQRNQERVESENLQSSEDEAMRIWIWPHFTILCTVLWNRKVSI
jgi:DNA topoisomerase IB